MLKINNNSSQILPAVVVSGSEKSPDLEQKTGSLYHQMVANLKDFPIKTAKTNGEVVSSNAELTISQVMNLERISLGPSRTQLTTPSAFFRQLGCENPPKSCTSDHIKGFFQLVDSWVLTDQNSIRDFLAFDVFSTIQEIHATCPLEMKPEIKRMIEKWYCIQAKRNQCFAPGDKHTFFCEISLFHAEMKTLLAGSYLKKARKLELNFNFLMQFSELEYQGLLDQLMKRCSGTRNLRPKQINQLPVLLKNYQNYCKYLTESRIVAHNHHLVETFPDILIDVLNHVNRASQAQPSDLVLEGKKLAQVCSRHVDNLMSSVLSMLDCNSPSYRPDDGKVELSLLMHKASGFSKRNYSKYIELLQLADILNHISETFEFSVASIIDHDYVKKIQYIDRINLVFNSIFSDLEECKENAYLVDTSPNSSTDDVPVRKLMENLRRDLFRELLTPNFYHRAEDFLTSYKSDSFFPLICMRLKLFHRILKPLAIKYLERLTEACGKYPGEELQSVSLFEETQWLAKVFLFVHDMEIFLSLPDANEEIDFPKDYIRLIQTHDPSVRLGDLQEELEVEGPLAIVPKEKEVDQKAELVRVSRPKMLSPSHAPVSRPVREKLTRDELNQDILDTKGDLRRMSQVLRRKLGGWVIAHKGARHPTVLDHEKRPIAPVPSTGHASLGTLRNVARRVCDAAEAQNLI